MAGNNGFFMISDNTLKTWKAVADESAQDISTLGKMDLFHNMEVLFPEYFLNISILWNWTKLWKSDFPTFFYNISKKFHTMEEVLFASAILCYEHLGCWETQKRCKLLGYRLVIFNFFFCSPNIPRVKQQNSYRIFILCYKHENARKPFSSKDMVTVFLFFNKIIDIWRAGIHQQHIPMFLNSLIYIFANLTCWVL